MADRTSAFSSEEEAEDEEKILYDVLTPCEWPETLSVLPVEEGHSLWRTIARLTRACWRFVAKRVRHPLSSLRRVPIPPSALVGLINSQLPWQLSISSNGQYLVVLREDELEMRSIEDSFESVTHSCRVAKDPRPQWRRVVWNRDNTMVAVGTSNGGVVVFSRTGKKVCSVQGTSLPAEPGRGRGVLVHACTGLAFMPPPKDSDSESCSLLAVLNYGGLLNTYLLCHERPPVCLHSFSLLSHHPSGVGSLVYHDDLNLLIAGSCGPTEGTNSCVSGWRLLDAFPHWAPMAGREHKKKQKRFFEGVVSSNTGVVFRLALSPSGMLLASIDSQGQLCVWEVPSLRLHKSWSKEELPVSDSGAFPAFGSTETKKDIPMLVDVCWWSDKALILLNTAGEVTVSSILSLDNLLGDTPEKGLCITAAHDGQFMMLECDQWRPQVGHHLPSFSEDFELGEEEEEEEDFSLSRASASLFKQMLYFLTESEKFRPPRKKAKLVARQYQLACLKSMAPEECYQRKMLQEEYGEALMLARQYGLDCDLVYQRQWEAHPVTIASIQDYLSKVTKHSWVLQECLSRVPEECDAARELLRYGLIRTSFQELKKAVSKVEEEEEEEEDKEDKEEEEEDEEKWKPDTKELTKREIEAEIKKWKKMTPEQASICQYRHMLLNYLNRLNTYEEILGGPVAVDEHFDSEFFQIFRTSNLVMTAVDFARDSNWQSLKTLFTYHGDVLLPHRLAILSNFPETTPPSVYQSLLPTVSDDGGIEEMDEERHSEPDWLDSAAVRSLCSLPNEAHANSGSFIYEQFPEWKRYESPSSGDILTEWYVERATEIEQLSGQVSNALSLIEMGMKWGVEGLQLLHHELLTLHTLVYQCNADSRLTVSQLKQMSELEILQLIMKEFCGADFIEDFCNRAVPFLKRIDGIEEREGAEKGRRRKRLLEEYLTTVATEDLEPCLAAFQQSRGKGPCGSQEAIVVGTDFQVTLALKCIYACKRVDQLKVADMIVQCLPLSSAQSSQDLSELHLQLDKLEDHLSASDILISYGVQKPIHFIRDIQDNAEEAKQLMIKLTRVASRKQPPLTEAGWRNLLQHLLSLKTRVFGCVDHMICYQVFVESLLCSGQQNNIQLASQLLTLSSSSPPSTSISSHLEKQGFGYQLPVEVSLQLVLSAAREYFNSAANLMDKDMDLARTCLALFPAPPPLLVQQELNLIASLSLLDDFGLSILPVQIRLCEDKLDIIRQALNSSTTAYRSHEKITRLSHLLGLDDPQEVGRANEVDDDVGVVSGWGQQMSPGKGNTLILVASEALKNGNMNVAHTLCCQLMEAKFSEAWKICRKLSGNEKLTDASSRLALLDFSLTHCPPAEIRAILEERGALEARMLCSRMQGLVAPGTTGGVKMERGGGGGGGGGAVQQLVGRGVQNIVSRSAGAVQQLIGLKSSGGVVPVDGETAIEVIEKCSSLLREAVGTCHRERENIPLRPSHHPFYNPLEHGKECYSNLKLTTASAQCVLNQALLRTLMLTSTLSDGEMSHSGSEVLLHLAEECNERDIHLFLAYLLSLTEPEEADRVFSKIAPDRFSLQTAIHYFCLQLHAMSGTHELVNTPHPFLHPPSKLMDHVIGHVTSTEESDWPEKCHPVIQLLHKYRELLADHTQAEVLQGLGLGIDVQRFTQDSSYKYSTVLSLARTTDAGVFSTAVLLATRHNIAEWEVYMSLLDWLLTSGKIKTNEIQERLSEAQIIRVLFENPQKTADSLMEKTYPNLPGSKYGILLIFYTVLQQCADRGAQLKEEQNVDVHVKLLKKFKTALPGIDYKALMKGADPLGILMPVLSHSNVHVVAKLANKIPCQLQAGGVLVPGIVYAAFAEKLFWSGDEGKTQPKSTAEWAHQFESCHDYLMRLSPQQLQQFVHNILLSSKAFNLLSISSRIELMKRCVKFCQKRVKPTAASSLGETSDNITFETLTEELKSSLKHLQNLHSAELATPKGVTEDEWKEYVAEFDFSLSQPDKMRVLSSKMVCRGLPLPAVATFLSLAQPVHSHSLTVTEIVQEALSQSVLQTNDEELELDLKQVEAILTAVSEHECGGGSLVSSSDVLEVLRPLCSEGRVRMDQKKMLLLIMEKYLFLSKEDAELILLYQTQSILAHFHTQVSISDLSSTESQQLLCDKLLQEASTSEHLLSLAALLESWPNSSSALVSCWTEILLALANKQEQATHRAVVTVRANLQCVPDEVDDQIFVLLLAGSLLNAMKFSLVSQKEHLFQRAMENMKEGNSVLCDADLMELILHFEKVPSLVDSKLYPQLCHYLKSPEVTRDIDRKLLMRVLDCSESEVEEELFLASPSERVKKAVFQLYHSGMKMEAGSLSLSLQLFHPVLMTLNNALAFLSSSSR